MTDSDWWQNASAGRGIVWKKRTETFAVGFESSEAARTRADALNLDPPKDWIKGSFRVNSQRETFTRKRVWIVIGERVIYSTVK